MKHLLLILVLLYIVNSTQDITVPSCSYSKHNIEHFQTFDKKELPVKFVINICHWNYETLEIDFFNQDYFIKSDFNQCNDPIFEQDVVDIFITDQLDGDITNYFEIGISPSNTMFIAEIKYNNGYIMDTIYRDCDENGIHHKTDTNKFEASWHAYLSLPLSLINKSDTISHDYKFNFFRIDIFSGWYCQGTTNCHYFCYNPTTIDKPNFHRPEYMLKMHLE